MFPSQALQFIINVQHDCAASGCDAIEDIACIQEYQETTKTKKVIKHCDNAHFIINTHALHNAAQLVSSFLTTLLFLNQYMGTAKNIIMNLGQC